MTRKHTILIVDDARHNRTALREILNDNYIVLEAENGQNALAVLEEKYQAVTVIILDLIMPDMSGLELLEIFHKDVRYQKDVYKRQCLRSMKHKYQLWKTKCSITIIYSNIILNGNYTRDTLMKVLLEHPLIKDRVSSK